MSKLKSYQEQIQQSIDKGIGIVENQYKSLMARPFGLAEKVEVQTKNISVSELRAKHDQAVDSLSESLRTFNKKLNTYVSDVLVRIEGGAEKAVENLKQSQPVQEAAKKVSSAKNKASAKTAETA